MLCKMFQTNHHVVRQAVRRLVNLGWVTTYQGKGSFVRSKPKPIPYLLSSNTGFSRNLMRQGVSHRSSLLNWELRPPEDDERCELKLCSGDTVYDLRILRFINGEPVSLTTSILRESGLPRLSDYLDNFQSLYRLLFEHYQLRPIRSKSVFQAVLPDREDTRQLQLPENVPIVRIDSLSLRPDGMPLELSRSKIRSDRCRYIIEF